MIRLVPLQALRRGAIGHVQDSMFLIPDGQGVICPQVQHTLSAPRSLVGTRKVLLKRELKRPSENNLWATGRLG